MPLSVLLALRTAAVLRVSECQKRLEKARFPKDRAGWQREIDSLTAALRWLDQQAPNDVVAPLIADIIETHLGVRP